MTMRVLVVGGSGMLGHKLTQILSAEPRLEVHCTVREMPADALRAPRATYHAGVEIGAGHPQLGQVLRALGPDVVVNAVGAIKQKQLDSAMEETFFLNATLPHLLPLLNPNKAARLIHFSTDCVFVGDRGGYRESDAPDALDLYGRSKACGEVIYGNHLTIRTSIIGFELGSHLGLVSWFLRNPPGSTLSGYTRAIFSGLPTVSLSRTVLEIILHRPGLRGLFHVASEPIAKFELLERINRSFGTPHKMVPSDSVAIDRSLDDSSFREATRTNRPDWDTLVEEMVEDFRSLPYAGIYGIEPPVSAAFADR